MNLRRRRRPSPAIPIVALVDILVITLLFIVATTTFRKRQTRVKLNLPTASKLGTTTPADDTRKSLSITKDQKYMLDGKEIPPAELVAALTQLKASSPSAKLEVSTDKAVPHGMWVTAVDALAKSGFVKDTTELIQRVVEGANSKP